MATSATPALSRLRLAALAITLIVLVQAGLGIASLTGHHAVNEVHGILGYVNFLLAIAAAVFGFQASKANAAFKGLFMHAASLPVLAVAQIGIIEAGKGNDAMKWVHVVLGIAYLVAAVGLYTLSDKRSKESLRDAR